MFSKIWLLFVQTIWQHWLTFSSESVKEGIIVEIEIVVDVFDDPTLDQVSSI